MVVILALVWTLQLAADTGSMSPPPPMPPAQKDSPSDPSEDDTPDAVPDTPDDPNPEIIAPGDIDELNGRTFGGYNCQSDCAEEEAGYRWAAQHGVEQASDCPKDKPGFSNGCRAYVDDPSHDVDRDDGGRKPK